MKEMLFIFVSYVGANILTEKIGSIGRFSMDEASLRGVFKAAFMDINCGQVIIDNTYEAEYLLKIMHNSLNTPGFINGKHEKEFCSEQIYLVYIIDNLWSLLKAYPIKDTWFYIYIIEGENYEIQYHLKSFNREIKVFQNSAGYIINLSNLTNIFKYNQIQQKFIIKNFDEIKTKENYHMKDFGGKHLKVATFNCSVHSNVGPIDRSGRPKYIGGVELLFFDVLSKKLNFTYTIKIPEGKNSYGKVSSNGMWSKYGVIGMVGEKQADVAFCGLWVSSYLRKSALEITDPIDNACVKYLVPRPGNVLKKGSGLVGPFDKYIWITISVAIVIVPLSSSITATLAIQFSKWKDIRVIKSYTNYFDSFMKMWGIILSNPPKSFINLGPLKHVTCSWALLALFLSTFYSCSLRSNLMKVNTARDYDTIQDLVEGDLYWVLDYSMDFKFLFNLDDSWHKRWVHQFEKTNIRNQCELVRTKKVAILANQYKEGVVIHREIPCLHFLNSYRTSKECVVNMDTAFILQHKSPYKEPFSRYIKKFQENGGFIKEYRQRFHLLSLKENYVLQSLESGKQFDWRAKKLGLYNLFSSFFLLAAGLTLAFIIFLIEFALNCYKSGKPVIIDM